MKAVKGNKVAEINQHDLIELLKNFEKVSVDFGTGDGRYIVKKASLNPETFYIGVDPSHTQLETYSKKANRKNLNNIIFLIGSLEVLPQELNNIAEELTVYFPWGTLLEAFVKPNQQSIKSIMSILKENGIFKLILGYHVELEPSEAERLELPELSEDTLQKNIIPRIEKFGNLKLESLSSVTKEELKLLDTTWSKRLAYGKTRTIYELNFRKTI